MAGILTAKAYNDGKRALAFRLGDAVRVTNRVGGRGALSHFARRFLGPCEVTKVINRNAYRLRLPAGRESTFHVSLLEPWRTTIEPATKTEPAETAAPGETPAPTAADPPTAEPASPEGEASPGGGEV